MITRSSANDALRAAVIERQRRSMTKRRVQAFETASEYAAVLSSGRYQRGVQHLELLMSTLDHAATVGGQRIIVSVPVRHGKSTSGSHYFPVSFLDRWPEKNIILASHEANFARTWGRKVRNSIDEFKAILRARLAEDSKAADRWNTDEGGGMTTAGVGGSITGRGADLLVVDDPVKNWEKAQSKADRDRVWDWWTGTAYPRLEPGASVVIIMARWHLDDLAGRIKAHEREGGDKFTEIRLPAIAGNGDPLGRAPGEALWPDRYDEEALKRIELTTTPQVWNSLYQQQPQPPGGSIFKRSWFVHFMAMPHPSSVSKMCRAWDCAATKDGGDYTVGLLLALLRDGRWVVLDIVRKRVDPEEVDALIKATALQDGPEVRVYEEQEGGSSGKAVTMRRERDLQAMWVERFRKRGQYHAVHPTGEKTTRWTGVAGVAASGNLWLIEGAPWVREFIAELSEVPNASNDDQADALTGAHDDLTIGPVSAPPPVVRAVPVSGFG